MFGEMVRDHRRLRGLSQTDLAALAGLSVRGLRKLESDGTAHPRPVTLRLLADALELPEAERALFYAAALGARPAPAADRAVPRQLPPDVLAFAGRTRELAELDRFTAAFPAPSVVAISGLAGVGKTSLAVRWSRSRSDRFPDGQLYVNLRGYTPDAPPVTPGEALRGLIESLGHAPRPMPADLPGRAALWRTVLAGRRILLLLDNAGNAEDLRWLLPGTDGSVVLITSRDTLLGLLATTGGTALPVGLPTIAEAGRMLAARLGADRLDAEPGPAHAIITRCGRLPLALAIVAARGAVNTGLSLAALAGELDDDTGRADRLSGPDPATDLRGVFGSSYQRLGPATARLFRLLSLHPGAEIGTAAAASLTGEPADRTRRHLTELRNASLVDEQAAGRFRVHDLVTAYAGERSRQVDSAAERAAATRRMIDHYLHTAHAAARLLYPQRESAAPPAPAPGVTVSPHTGERAARAWFVAGHDAVLACVDLAIAEGLDAHVGRFATALATYLHRGGHWTAWADTQRKALEAAQRRADPALEASSARQLARAYIQLGRLDEADAQLRAALRLFDRTADDDGRGHTHIGMTMVYDRQGRHVAALTHARLALRCYLAAGNVVGEANARNTIGWHLAQLGKYHAALAPCELALELNQRIGNKFGAADTWDSLGYAHDGLGDTARALECYTRALELREGFADQYEEAVTLVRLGDVRYGAGRPEAHEDWLRALAIYTELDHPAAEAVRARLSGAGLPPGRPGAGLK
jgi:tetratricopeptide (TPR) repeat protein/transcriptional regulator with XRE-family HTH domain